MATALRRDRVKLGSRLSIGANGNEDGGIGPVRSQQNVVSPALATGLRLQ